MVWNSPSMTLEHQCLTGYLSQSLFSLTHTRMHTELQCMHDTSHIHQMHTIHTPYTTTYSSHTLYNKRHHTYIPHAHMYNHTYTSCTHTINTYHILIYYMHTTYATHSIHKCITFTKICTYHTHIKSPNSHIYIPQMQITPPNTNIHI
jgi:hypothetical protein